MWLARPAAVITSEDNALEFYFAKIYLPDTRTICLQNGRRDTFSHDPERTLWETLREKLPASATPDVILAHGQPAVNYYQRSLISDSPRILVAGNLTNNSLPLNEDSIAPRLLFVSSFPNLGEDSDLGRSASRLLGYWRGTPLTFGEFYLAEGIVAGIVAKYAKLQGLPFGIIGKRPSWQRSERHYFQAVLGESDWLYFPCETKGSSYGVVTSRDVLVNIDSTFGYEMMARGVRVAFVAARMPLAGHPEIRDCDFAYPFITAPSGLFWTNEASHEEVSRVIDAVVARPNSEWCAEAGIDMGEIFRYDKGNTILCKTLDEFGIQNSGPKILG